MARTSDSVILVRPFFTKSAKNSMTSAWLAISRGTFSSGEQRSFSSGCIAFKKMGSVEKLTPLKNQIKKYGYSFITWSTCCRVILSFSRPALPYAQFRLNSKLGVAVDGASSAIRLITLTMRSSVMRISALVMAPSCIHQDTTNNHLSRFRNLLLAITATVRLAPKCRTNRSPK
jgi:hypothetical protein